MNYSDLRKFQNQFHNSSKIMIYLLEEVLLGVGSYLSSFVHFALWSLSYMQLRIGPYEKDPIGTPDDQKTQGGP